MKKQREIDDIIKELKNHPDYLNAEIFTWPDYLEEINDYLEDGLSPIELDEISPKLRKKIIKNVIDGFSIAYNSGFDFFLQLTRDAKNNKPKLQN